MEKVMIHDLNGIARLAGRLGGCEGCSLSRTHDGGFALFPWGELKKRERF